MKKMMALITAIFLGMSLTACSGGTSGTPANPDIPTGVSGRITISGSSALYPLVQAAANDMKSANPGLSITVNAGGSGQGLQNVYDKTVDIGNSDIFAEEKLDADKASALVDHRICVVGVAVVVNPDVAVTNLTKAQLIDIFTGKIRNWKEVGGSDQEIVVISRPASSGTRALFKAYALDGMEEAAGHSLTEDNSGILRQNVAQTKGAISYLAFSYLDRSVKAVSVDGVASNYDNVYSGAYPIWGYEHMYTRGEASGASKALIDYIMSDSFAKTITQKGYGLVGKMTVQRGAPTAKS